MFYVEKFLMVILIILIFYSRIYKEMATRRTKNSQRSDRSQTRRSPARGTGEPAAEARDEITGDEVYPDWFDMTMNANPDEFPPEDQQQQIMIDQTRDVVKSNTPTQATQEEKVTRGQFTTRIGAPLKGDRRKRDQSTTRIGAPLASDRSKRDQSTTRIRVPLKGDRSKRDQSTTRGGNRSTQQTRISNTVDVTPSYTYNNINEAIIRMIGEDDEILDILRYIYKDKDVDNVSLAELIKRDLNYNNLIRSKQGNRQSVYLSPNEFLRRLIIRGRNMREREYLKSIYKKSEDRLLQRQGRASNKQESKEIEEIRRLNAITIHNSENTKLPYTQEEFNHEHNNISQSEMGQILSINDTQMPPKIQEIKNETGNHSPDYVRYIILEINKKSIDERFEFQRNILQIGLEVFTRIIYHINERQEDGNKYNAIISFDDQLFVEIRDLLKDIIDDNFDNYVNISNDIKSRWGFLEVTSRKINLRLFMNYLRSIFNFGSKELYDIIHHFNRRIALNREDQRLYNLELFIFKKAILSDKNQDLKDKTDDSAEEFVKFNILNDQKRSSKLLNNIKNLLPALILANLRKRKIVDNKFNKTIITLNDFGESGFYIYSKNAQRFIEPTSINIKKDYKIIMEKLDENSRRILESESQEFINGGLDINEFDDIQIVDLPHGEHYMYGYEGETWHFGKSLDDGVRLVSRNTVEPSETMGLELIQEGPLEESAAAGAGVGVIRQEPATAGAGAGAVRQKQGQFRSRPVTRKNPKTRQESATAGTVRQKQRQGQSINVTRKRTKTKENPNENIRKRRWRTRGKRHTESDTQSYARTSGGRL
jgi:hypothetical protein